MMPVLESYINILYFYSKSLSYWRKLLDLNFKAAYCKLAPLQLQVNGSQPFPIHPERESQTMCYLHYSYFAILLNVALIHAVDQD